MKFDVNFLCRLIVSFSYFNTCTYCIRECELNSFEKQSVSCLENSFQDHAVLDLKTIKTCKFNMHRDTIFVNFCYAIFAAAKLHRVSNMFETPAISRRQIARGLHVRF